MNGTPQTTATVLANNGVHQLTGASTLVLAGPRVGSLVTGLGGLPLFIC